MTHGDSRPIQVGMHLRHLASSGSLWVISALTFSACGTEVTTSAPNQGGGGSGGTPPEERCGPPDGTCPEGQFLGPDSEGEIFDLSDHSDCGSVTTRCVEGRWLRFCLWRQFGDPCTPGTIAEGCNVVPWTSLGWQLCMPDGTWGACLSKSECETEGVDVLGECTPASEFPEGLEWPGFPDGYFPPECAL